MARSVSRIPRPCTAPCCCPRPAESAVRRLIVIAARGLVVKLAPSRPMPEGARSERAAGLQLPPSSSSIRGNVPKPTPGHEIHEDEPRIHFFAYDPRIGDMYPAPRPVVVPRRRPMAWSMQRASPQAPGPQARPRRSAAPGQASRPLAAEAESRAMAEVHVTAPAGPSAGLPEEAHSRSR